MARFTLPRDLYHGKGALEALKTFEGKRAIICVGGIGSDAAMEAADMVILTDDLSRLPDVIRLAKKTMRLVKENITFALLVKAVILVLSAIGCGNLWLAVFADVGVSVLCIMNALRAK